MSIFQKSVINKYLKNLDKAKLDKAFGNFKDTFTSEKIEIIKSVKEEEYQDGFLRDLFVNVLGYKLNIDSKEHDLVREKKNQTDAKKADGAIIKDGKVTAVIELKDTKTKDMGSFTEQAFGYKNSQESCKYVITSNFHKLRFYIDNKVDFEEFNLFELGRDDFELLYLILNKESIFSDIPAKLKEETKFHEETVSNKLYSDYSSFKKNLFSDMTINNPQYDKLTLFKKSQKLIDRFLFILFAEDRGLLPPNSTARMITRFDVLKSEDSYKPLYDICRQYFGYMNTGNHKENIPAYNGGLFLPDDILDSLKISDGILRDHLWKLSSYDYVTEIDVNILGHIFEHSLSEIEEITAEIEGIKTDKAKSKRKKDGVYYTPKYITQYIVEHTVGTLCREKRKELGIVTIEFDEKAYRKANGFLTEKGKELFNRLEAYKQWLFSLKILDPACGSGAFLIQALNFLIQEHKTIDDIIAELTGSPLRLFDTDKAILENNLYGVDINDESVEIAKLSLWLHTARKDRKLSDLNNNIKCGNSLIEDPKVAGDKAFDWNKEFKNIMQAGGFDVVIGNPPYVNIEAIQPVFKEYYKSNYKFFYKRGDLFSLFIENSITKLSTKGRVAFIVPSIVLTNLSYKLLRDKILDNQMLEEIYYTGYGVFNDAIVDTIILTLSMKHRLNTIRLMNALDQKAIGCSIVPYDYFSKFNNVLSIGNTDSNTINDKVFAKNNIEVNAHFKVFQGIVTGNNEAFIFDDESLPKNNNIESDLLHTLCHGRDIGKWYVSNTDRKILYIDSNTDMNKNENAYKWLLEFKEDLSKRRECLNGVIPWYSLQWPRIKSELDVIPKIAIQSTRNERLQPRIVATIDNFGFYSSQGINFIIPSSNKYSVFFLIAILNSKLTNYVFTTKFLNLAIKAEYLKKYKYPDCDNIFVPMLENNAKKMTELNQELYTRADKFFKRFVSNFENIKISNKLESFYEHDFKTFVDELKKQKIALSLKQQDEWEEYFNSYKKEINDLQTEIKKTDAEIDQMVYKLYELTDEEIRIVEEK